MKKCKDISPILLIISSCFLIIPQCLGDNFEWITVCDNDFLRVDEPMNWFEATEFCNRYDLALVSVDSCYKQNCLATALTKGATGGNYVHWTSGSDLSQSDRFVWQPTGSQFVFSSWAYNQPRNGDLDKRCVKIIFNYDGTSDTFWARESCEQRMDVICEIPFA